MSLESLSKKKKLTTLRFGIICEGRNLYEREVKCIEKLLSLGNTKFSLVVFLKNRSNCRKLSFYNRLFWNIYSFLVKRRSKALRDGNTKSLFSKIPSLYCNVFQKEEISEIKKYNLDFIIYLGAGKIEGEILNVPRLGVWLFHYGTDEQSYATPFGFWEIYRNEKITRVSLQRLIIKHERGIILKEGFFKTINDSYIRNLDSIYFEISEWPAKVCIDIKNNGASYFDTLQVKSSPQIQKTPSNLETIFFLFKLLISRIVRWYYYLFFYEKWNIGIVKSPIHEFLETGRKPVIKWLPSPERRKFNADPFAIMIEKDIYIFFEEYDYSILKGYISTIKIHKGVVSIPEKVWESPFHISYPYIVKDKNNIYCIPETSQVHKVALYRANSFPGDWVKIATLIKGFGGIDSTAFQYNGKWWLMTTDINDRPTFHRLMIWYADDLLGPWKAHYGNPVKTDVRSARSAGTPFFYNGSLYRPAQDCSGNYGGRIIINKIVKLTPTEFKEEEITAIEPDQNSPYPDGIHTISRTGNITIVDGVKRIFTIWNPSILVRKLRHIFF